MNKLETDAIKSLIEFIGNSILVGHHVDFDVEMINVALEKLECGIENEALDIDMMHLKLNDITDKQFSLNQLSDLQIPQSEEILQKTYKTALLFLKLKSRLELNKPIVG
jgi:DNA polymerase-3 subunit epsilon